MRDVDMGGAGDAVDGQAFWNRASPFDSLLQCGPEMNPADGGRNMNREVDPASPGTVKPRTTSEITCPKCGTRRSEVMPTDACIYYYECTACGAVLQPKAGDCCVFCSYGSVPCPPVQIAGRCCADAEASGH